MLLALAALQAPEFSTLEEIREENRRLRNCQYFVAFTDDLEMDGFFFEGIPRTGYVRSDATEFASFIDDQVVHFRGDITPEALRAFAARNGPARCRTPFLRAPAELAQFDSIPVVLLPDAGAYEALSAAVEPGAQVAFAAAAAFQVAPAAQVQLLLKCGATQTHLASPGAEEPAEALAALLERARAACALRPHAAPADVPPQTDDRAYFYWREYARRRAAGLAPAAFAAPRDDYVHPRTSPLLREPPRRRPAAERAAYRERITREGGSNRQAAEELVAPGDPRYARPAPPPAVEPAAELLADA